VINRAGKVGAGITGGNIEALLKALAAEGVRPKTE
jgi:hypothetical protein